MALTKTTENDKIEIVNRWNIQVRQATIIKEDDKELTRSFHRKVLVPGSIDGSNNWTETDISEEDADVQAICNAVWTTAIKNEYKQNLIDKKPV